MKKHKDKKHSKKSHHNDRDDSEKKSHKKDHHHKKHKKQKYKYSSDDDSSNNRKKYSKSSRKESVTDFNDKPVQTKKENVTTNEYELLCESTRISSSTNQKSYKTHNQKDNDSFFEAQSTHKVRDCYTTDFTKEKSVNIEESQSLRADNNYYSKKHEKRKNTENFEEEPDEDFSYLKYKHDFNKVLSSFNLVKDVEEFWMFVKEFEVAEKKFGRSIKKTSKSVNSIGVPETYDKLHRINCFINYGSRELFMRIQEIKELTEDKLLGFKNILTIYFGFKNNEKFRKLRKLRWEQGNLPVAQYKDEIINAVKNERVVIIAGDTGCGKSTQIPQYLYKSGFGRIACTQPRRIACISLAKRVAYETLTENQNEVGYQIRFERQKSQDTKITFITEGLLLRQIAGESDLSQYDVVVLDEVHERHLHGDFLLGIMKCLIHQRTDLKLILMSATINIELFKQYFSHENAKVIQVPGRLYPIELIYRPIPAIDKYSKSERFDPSPYVQIMQMIDKKYPTTEKGDLLIFLSGMSEITAVVEAAKDYSKKENNWIVLPLHSTLSIADQDKVFDYAPEGVRKCIVSTNIAETSITIDGIRFVIDSGKVKEMSYDPICKMQKLKEFWISKASSEQRKGRAGRTGPGVCYRLYSGDDYSAFEKYSTAELQRVPLDSSLLQMISMGLPDPRKFPFIEPPPVESIENSILSLKEHAALSENEKLTNIGKTLAKLPVDITIGKMLIMGSLFHQIEPILSLTAALSVQSPFTNKAYRDLDCEAARKNLESDYGEPITLLNAYKEWLEMKHSNNGDIRSGNSGTKKWCKRRGLEEQRFYEMTKLRTQFKDLLQDCNLLEIYENSDMSSSERILRHGELKILRSLKRSYKQNDSRKRKQLKLQDNIMIDDDKEDEEIDIKDIEFRMKNDFSQLNNLVTASTACSYKDLTMIKLILCSGLYPQIATADEFNYCKTVSEQLFHTKVKPFVALHPMSFFGTHPQVLQIEEPDIVNIPGYKSKTPISPKHQILIYLSLLETTKPYLMNTLRMPAAQTLLLFAQEIDTNSTFTTLVCDSWLSLDFPNPDCGAFLLFQAAKLRQKWDNLLNIQLQDSSTLQSKKENTAEMEYELSKGLVDFMHTSVPYTIKRLLAADLKSIYIGRGSNSTITQPNPFSTDFECEPHNRKGGVCVTKQITFNCLIESEWSDKIACEMLEVEWECHICQLKGVLSSYEKLQHMTVCNKESTIGTNEKSSLPTELKKKNSTLYECQECQQNFFLTPTEILKHRKQHEV